MAAELKPVAMLALALTFAVSPGSGWVQAQTSDSEAGLKARGLIASPMKVELRTLLLAPVAELPFRAGERFEADALLLGFDCDRYRAEENAALAAAEAARIDHVSKKRLLKRGAAGKDEVHLAGAKARQANAELRIRQVTNNDCEIRAPFTGRVAALNIRKHEYPDQGDPLLIIIDDTVLEVELIVPSKWLVWLKPGSRFDFMIEETGAVADGTVERLSPEIDPVSQTIRIFGKLHVNEGVNLLPGMSGVARFDEQANG